MNKKEDILNSISNLNLIELNNLIKDLEKKFNISNSMLNNINNNTEKVKEKEKTEYSVILSFIGKNKISVIKTIREITGLGLKDSKDLVDNIPKIIKKNINKMDAEIIRKKLEEVGARVEFK